MNRQRRELGIRIIVNLQRHDHELRVRTVMNLQRRELRIGIIMNLQRHELRLVRCGRLRASRRILLRHRLLGSAAALGQAPGDPLATLLGVRRPPWPLALVVLAAQAARRTADSVAKLSVTYTRFARCLGCAGSSVNGAPPAVAAPVA